MLEKLKAKLEKTIGREMKTSRDFDFLAARIYALTQAHISSTTLIRMWGYLEKDQNHKPQPFTLNICYVNYIMRINLYISCKSIGITNIYIGRSSCSTLYLKPTTKATRLSSMPWILSSALPRMMMDVVVIRISYTTTRVLPSSIPCSWLMPRTSPFGRRWLHGCLVWQRGLVTSL